MRSMRATFLLTAFASLFAAGASCGQNQPAERVTEPTAEGPAEEGGGGGPTKVPPNLDLGGLGPLPGLPPGARSTTPAARPVPRIDALPAAEDAFSRGFYGPVEQALPRFTKGRDEGRALLLLARVQHETGRHDDAASTAERAARTRELRVPAETLRAEALLARGRLDDAERILSALAAEPTAHRARVLLGRLLIARGRPVEARPHLMALISAYNDDVIGERDGEGLAYVAMAAWALGSHQDANDAFQESTRAAPDRVETQLEWAQMFFEKYDTGHAEESVNDVLEHNPEHPLAHALLARIRIEQSFDFAAAEQEVDRALAVNPNLVPAHVTRAGIALRDLDIAAADRHLARALEVNPNDLETLSVRAAVRYLADDEAGFERAKQEVFRRNRSFSEMFTIIGEYAEWEHRYPDIVRMGREAVTINPDDALALATMGLNQLRTGEETAGLESLRQAWQRDHFNVQVFNTLELYDDVISQSYVSFPHGPFMFRMHNEERPVLERYVPPTLQGAWTDMVRRYGFTPAGPVHIEMYADDQHFSVRTMGLPNLGVQGVCFGQVVTALSPRAGSFNWGQITWHELAHVFHIQLSRHRVPRWFTEGLAEYETLIARPEWRRELDHDLHAAVVNDRLPPLALMNRAFTHARSGEEMMTAYYASTQIVKYIAERFGFPKVVEMLTAWGRGTPTADVIRNVLRVSIEDLDRDFRAHTRGRLAARDRQLQIDFGRYQDVDALRRAAEAAPDDAGAQAALAAGLLVAGNAEEARAAAERAVARESGQPLARFILARLAMAGGDEAAAEQHVRAILAGGRDGYELRILLARLAMGRGDAAAVRRELEAATTLDPDRAEAWAALAEIGEASQDQDLRLRSLLRLARIEEHDRETSAALLELLAARSMWRELVEFGEMARFVDPERAESHRLLAEGYLHTDRARDALPELEVALLAGHEQPGLVHLSRARAYMALGRRNEAGAAARQATEADGSLADQARQILGGG